MRSRVRVQIRKREGGAWIYKVKRQGGRELWIDGMTAATFAKGQYTRAMMNDGKPRPAGTDWGKLVLDLHTGKIGGEIGKAIMTAASVTLLFLTLSGVYLYAKPLLIRRRNAANSTKQAIDQLSTQPARLTAEVLVRQKRIASERVEKVIALLERDLWDAPRRHGRAGRLPISRASKLDGAIAKAANGLSTFKERIDHESFSCHSPMSCGPVLPHTDRELPSCSNCDQGRRGSGPPSPHAMS